MYSYRSLKCLVMSEVFQVVDAIAFKVKEVDAKLSHLALTNKQLQEEIVSLKAINSELTTKLSNYEEELESLRIAKSMLGSDEYKKETKLKINNIIREIDNCIQQLSV